MGIEYDIKSDWCGRKPLCGLSDDKVGYDLGEAGNSIDFIRSNRLLGNP